MLSNLKSAKLYQLLFFVLSCSLLFITTLISKADSGVLIATETGLQNDNVLSMESMKVDIKIDNQHAYVKVDQIFHSQADHDLEGSYTFDLPDRATIADFAVWENLTRIPAVILEKHYAEEVYERISRPQEVDPGLLTQDDEHGGTGAFNVKVTPIPAYGNKRLELEYNEFLSIDGLTAQFSFPFKPSGNRRQHINRLNIHVTISSDIGISTPEMLSKTFPLTFNTINEHQMEASYSINDIDLTEDFILRYAINAPQSQLSFTAYRAPEKMTAFELRDPQSVKANPDGYFQTTAIYNQTQRSAQDRLNNANRNQTISPRHITLLLDNSLSMNGEKITRAYEAIDFFLHQLKPQDSFNIILFNEDLAPFNKAQQSATRENIEQALKFIRESPLGGGTSILPALKLALSQISSAATTNPTNDKKEEQSIILITDGNPTLASISTKEIVSDFDRLNQSGANNITQLYVFGLGGDVNQNLLAELVAKCQGYFVQYRETADLSTRFGFFFDKIGNPGINNIAFNSDDAKNFYYVYPIGGSLNQRAFDGASYSMVGRYKQPKDNVMISIIGNYNNNPLNLTKQVNLPELDKQHNEVPRLWARARVDALLREIDLNGERRELISEIIYLSQKYKFITPYTAFIAAPRALLRPRVIQPGDPVIRVKTDSSIASVLAVLPFGVTLPLKYLASEDVWEVRFLAPSSMPDGSYKFRLILTDKDGNGYQEEKSFIIDSHGPQLNIKVNNTKCRAGEILKIMVNADQDTAQLTARFYGAQPVKLQWSSLEKCSTGQLFIPADLPPGKYSLVVAAEDFAHNNSTAELEIEVIGS